MKCICKAETHSPETCDPDCGCERCWNTAEMKCVYCHYMIPATDDRPPAVDDDDEWERLALQHADDCEWCATRAHRR